MKRFLSLLAVLTVCLAALVISASAAELASGTCGTNLTWTLDDTGTLTISGTGSVHRPEGDEYPWSGYEDDVIHVVIEDTVTGIDYAAFAASKMKTVYISAGMQSVGQYAFMNCTELETVTLMGNTDEMSFDAFNNCSALTTLHLGKDVTSVSSVLTEHDSLTTITVDPENTAFSAENGILLHKNGRILLRCPAGKSQAVIPNSVLSIADDAFQNCSRLTALTVNGNINAVAGYAFSGCDQLTTLHLGRDVALVTALLAELRSLSEITVEEGNGTYSTVNGLLLSADGKTVLRCPKGRSQAVIPSGVTSIGDSAFSACTALGSVTIPNGVTSIGDSAFYLCTALKSVAIPGSVTNIGAKAFYECTFMGSATLESGVVTIGQEAFYKCDSMTRVNIPASVTVIGGKAFYGCSLHSVEIPGDGATTIGDDAFSYNYGLETVTIGSGVRCIASDAFRHCRMLKNLTISEGVTSIGTYAFWGCESLMTVELPASVTSLGNWVFFRCYDLLEVTVNGNISEVGNGVFWDCDAMTVLHLGKDVTWVSPGLTSHGGLLTISLDPANSTFSAAGGVLFSKDGKTLCRYPGGLINGELTIPAGVTAIDERAFYNYDSLTSVTVPANVTEIGDRVFADCDGLTSATVQAGSIGKSAFYSCQALDELTLGAGVTEIGEAAFADCDDLTSVTVLAGAIRTDAFCHCDYLRSVTLGADVTAIENGAFYSCSQLTDIYYGSTARRWAALGANLPDSITVHCTEITEILTHPADVTARLGSSAEFTVEADGVGLTYQWQYCTATGSTWKNTTLTGNKTDTLTVKATEGRDGYKYRCVITDGGGVVYCSDGAVLDVTVIPDTPTVSLSVKAANGKPRLTWKAVDGADKYEIWRAVGQNSGYSKIYTMTGTTYVNTSAKVGTAYYYKVRAVGEDGKSGFSTAKYVTCDCAQPVVSITLNANNKPKLSWEKVTGASKYEIWRAVGQDSGYKKIYTMTGNVFTNSSAKEGVTYYYKVRAVCGATTAGNSAFSAAKSVTVPIPLNIVSQPEDVSAALGGKAVFAVEATGADLSYQWQYCTAAGSTWKNTTLTGNKTDTLTVGVTAGRDGYKYRCVITDVNGDSVISECGVLSVE